MISVTMALTSVFLGLSLLWLDLQRSNGWDASYKDSKYSQTVYLHATYISD